MIANCETVCLIIESFVHGVQEGSAESKTELVGPLKCLIFKVVRIFHHFSFLDIAAQQSDGCTGVCRLHSGQVSQVLLVKADDVFKLSEVVLSYPPSGVPATQVVLLQCSQCSGVRLISDIVRGHCRAVYPPLMGTPSLLEEVSEHCFSHGRATDIPQTHKVHRMHLLSSHDDVYCTSEHAH